MSLDVIQVFLLLTLKKFNTTFSLLTQFSTYNLKIHLRIENKKLHFWSLQPFQLNKIDIETFYLKLRIMGTRCM